MANIQRPATGRQSRWGICTNPQCHNYRQKIEITRGEFICPEEECKKPLSPCAPPQQKKSFFEKNKKLIGVTGGVLVGIAAIGGGIYALTGTTGETGQTLPPKDTLNVTLNHTQKTLKVGESDTLVATVTPDGTQATLVWEAIDKSNAVEVSDGGIVTAKEEGESKVQVKATANGETKSMICAYIVKEAEPQPVEQPTNIEKKAETKETEPQPKQPTYGTLHLSYGTYTGDLKNGYPNGQGRLVYNQSRQISRYDSKGRTAQSGESVQGTFKNGFLTIGKHFDASGNLIESLNIGSPVDGVFESK